MVSAEELLERAWTSTPTSFTNTVRFTVTYLRRKLGDPSFITTVVGAAPTSDPT